jgi:hypothetical protein
MKTVKKLGGIWTFKLLGRKEASTRFDHSTGHRRRSIGSLGHIICNLLAVWELVRLAPAAHGSEPTRGRSSEIRNKAPRTGKVKLHREQSSLEYGTYMHHKTCVQCC